MLELDSYLDSSVEGLDLLRDIAAAEAETGLPMPPVPRPLVARLRCVASGVVGTGSLPRPLLAIADWMLEAPRAADYLVHGPDGRGLTRQFLHYYLCFGPLALFLQHGRDVLAEPPAAPGFAAALERVPALLDRLEAAQAAGRLAPEERLVLVDSDLVGRRWARTRPGDAEIRWRDEGQDPITAVTLAYPRA